MRKKTLLFAKALFVGAISVIANETDEDCLNPIGIESVALCQGSPLQQPPNPSIKSYFSELFTADNWPARWTCGEWSAMDGWIYIVSDLVIFATYVSIPLMLFFFLWKVNLGYFKILTFSFGVFILSCGLTHLIDAIIFWEPIYRFSGFIRAITAVVSVATVGLMIKSVPIALTFKSPATFQREIDRAVAETKELNTVLQESFQIAKIGTWKLDLTTNKVEWSDSLYDLYEIPRGTLIDLEMSLEMYPKQEKLIEDTISKAISTRSNYDLELLSTKPNGKQLWVKVIGIPHGEADEVVGIRGYVMDIDSTKQLEIERRESREKLEEEVNLRTRDLKIANEELEAFSYSVSHDLRAPLRAINGFSEALITDYKKDLSDDAQRYVSRIAANSKKMGELIDDLLEYSRMNRKQAQHEKVDTSELVRRIISDLFAEYEDVIEVGELPQIYGDYVMLNQVFTNLISNAVKYSSTKENQRVTITSREDSQAYTIAITDNGVGFNMDYYDKLFKVFQRLHSESEFEGTGIGLSLCAKIMHTHKGEIWAEAEEGKGATFYLKFKKNKK